MIVPGTRVRLARIPLARIVVTEHQPRYPDRVAHYLALLSAPEHATHDAGFVHLRRVGTCEPDGTPLYTILDGHHRFVACVLSGRSDVLALILTAPGEADADDSAEQEMVA